MSTTCLPDVSSVRVEYEQHPHTGIVYFRAPESFQRKEPSALSTRDLAIIRSVYSCRLMKAGQIERLHFQESKDPNTRARICRRVLKRLVGQDVLRRRERRIGGIRAGSASFIYSLGPKGARVVTDRRLHYYVRDPSDYFMEHTLALAELYVALHEQNRAGTFELLELQTEPGCWRPFLTLATGKQILKPDMFVRFGVGNDELSYFIELDRGTTYKTSLLRKLRVYESYYLTGREERQYGIFPQVLWVVPTAKRKSMLEELCALFNERIPGLFAVTTKDRTIEAMAEPEPP